LHGKGKILETEGKDFKKTGILLGLSESGLLNNYLGVPLTSCLREAATAKAGARVGP
jgi:hypothetical protein